MTIQLPCISRGGINTAERRMFTRKITDGDAFTALPPTTQALYFHLCMSADDDGFSNKIRHAMFNAHADSNDFNLLVTNRFIIPFDNGVIVIKHWRMHNLIKSDRYHETDYIDELSTLVLKENGEYCEGSGTQLEPNWNPTGTQLEPEVRLGKVSKGKVRIGKAKKDGLKALVDGVSDPELKEALNDFIKMRKEIKKPLTERALKIVLNKLDGLAADPHTQSLILLQSVEHCWQTVYALKKEEQKTKSIIDEWENA